MAYVIGLLTPEEAKKLESRGWELEDAPASLIPKDLPLNERKFMKQIWIDANMFDVLNCPTCCDRHCDECGAEEPEGEPAESLIADWHKDSCSLHPKNTVGAPS